MTDEFYYNKYLKYKTKYLNLNSIIPNKQLGGHSQNNQTEIYLFKADWCGHCRNFISTWDALSNDLGDKYNFNTIDVDNKENKKILKKYEKYIQGYPTIIKKSGDTINLFNGERNANNVREFITESN